jgi:hypothetical protein
MDNSISIEKLVVELLYERDIVVIPEFGAFITEERPAFFNPTTNEIIPPYKEIQFDQTLTSNDWILINYIASRTHKPIDIVEQQLKGFVKFLRGKILLQKSYEWPGLGELIYKDKQLYFKPFKNVNLNSESFGLPIISIKGVKQENNHEQPTTKRKKKKEAEEVIVDQEPLKEEIPEVNQKSGISYWVWFVFPAMIAVAVTGYLWDNRGNPATKSFNPFFDKSHIIKGGIRDTSNFNHEDPIGENIDAISIESIEKSNIKAIQEKQIDIKQPIELDPIQLDDNVPKQEKIKKEVVLVPNGAMISQKSNRCYIIFASFKDLKIAEKVRKKLEDEGAYNAKIIEPNDDKNVYRVSIDDFETKAEALEKAKLYREKYGENLWVHVF